MPRRPEEGQSLELTCQVKNLPPRFELVWYFNDHKLNPSSSENEETAAAVENKIETSASESVNYVLISTTTIKPNRRHALLSYHNKLNDGGSNGNKNNTLILHSHNYLAAVDRVHNVTVSRLKIKHLDWFHRGVYKCRYDQVEAFYNLDFESIYHLLFTKSQ